MDRRSAAERLFAGPGETRARLRRTDWAATPLGPVEDWPVELCSAVRTVLPSRIPMLLWWGPRLVQIFNDAYTPVLGDKYPEAIGQPGAECWAEVWDELGPLAQGVLDGAEATYTEKQFLLMRRHGYLEETYWTFSYSPVHAEDDSVVGVFVATTDVTSRVLSERRLETLRRLGTINLAGAEHPVTDACREAVRILADNRADLPVVAASLRGDGTEMAPAPTFRLESGAPAQLTEFPLTVTGWPEPVGELVVGISPYREFDDSYRGFLELVAARVSAILTDALAYETERHRASALADLDKAKTRFFQNVSHEFRTPLTLLIGPLEALLDQGSLPADQQHTMAAALRAARRLQRLVDTLLDVAKAEADQLQPQLEPVNPAQLTAECTAMFGSAAEDAGLDLRLDLGEGTSTVILLDQEMWAKVVLNLLSNALKFTHRGTIGVGLAVRDDELVLSVSDTGTGIPDTEQGRVFERFHQVEGTTGRTGEGAGIGLSLVSDLAAALGGAVSVDSTLGSGSTFEVTVPWRPVDAEAIPTVGAARGAEYADEARQWIPRPDEETDGTARPGEARVLLVEDNADMRKHILQLLRGQGWQVDAVAEVDTAIERIAAHRPHLVLSDVMLPGRDGVSLLRQLRSEPSTARLPVMLLTARAGADSTVDGLGHGADDYITKPFNPGELVARVRVNLELSWFREKLIAAGEREAADLRRALDTRSTVSEAVGLVMAAFRCDADAAFEKLVSFSQHRNIKVRDIAAEVVADFVAAIDEEARADGQVTDADSRP
ncbi:response regulator [Amycolatopsis magusensis]|uniref:histidine kinase n=1 Tax=Amycolatopsis magusensis TaxID=882444 RepID=A0ABS4PUM5_9PSEU|nr:response regulator [Amycolatopsis magusensis]MBP2183013.1 signal transduction histidine kinase/AmiR/NasT family two-component response regulator [Amycolatopsis magusensis]